MENKPETNFLIPILSAIAGAGALITSFSPLLFSNGTINQIFIDPRLIEFAIPATIVGSLFALWQGSSIRSYSLFKNTPNWEIVKTRLILMFGLFAILFYGIYFASQNNIIQRDLASIIQFCLYFLSFYCLLLGIGLLLRDSLYEFKKNSINETIYDRIRTLLIRSGRIDFDLSIESIQNHNYQNGEPIDWISGKDVVFVTKKKKYFCITSSDISQIYFLKLTN